LYEQSHFFSGNEFRGVGNEHEFFL
jgi:hypothetical protein